MKKTLTIYFFILSSLFLASCGSSVDSFFEDIKNNKIKSVKAAQRLINKGADIYEKDNDGSTLLHVVRSIEIAEFLLEKGLDIEAKNNKGETPLYTAIKRGHYDVALFLQKKGAYGFTKTNNKDDPYHLVEKHLMDENLSSEEAKLLEEITMRILEADTTEAIPAITIIE